MSFTIFPSGADAISPLVLPFFSTVGFLFGFLLLPMVFFFQKGDGSDGKDDEKDGEQDGGEDDNNGSGDVESDMTFDIRRAFESEEEIRDELLARIHATEKKIAAGGIGLEKSLAQDYLTLALDYQEEDDFDKTSDYLQKAIHLLSPMVTGDPDDAPTDDLVRMLGMARLTFGVVLNDQGMWSEALSEYQLAEGVMERLAATGDTEALLDLAGIRLNSATIHYELGDFDQSLAEFEKVRTDFSALLGTDREESARFYLARTSLQEAAVYRETGDEGKVVERMEEGIRLYRQLVTDGASEHRYDLALALLDYAQFQQFIGQMEPEEILRLLDEAIGYFQEAVATGRTDACPDLLTASLMKGRFLNYLKRNAEAERFLTDLSDIFAQLEETDDPSALLNLVSLYDERGKSRLALQNLSGAKDDLNKGVTIGRRIMNLLSDASRGWGHCHDEEEKESEEGTGGDAPERDEDDGSGGIEGESHSCGGHHSTFESEARLALFSAYIDRAKTLQLLRERDAARADCDAAGRILPFLKDFLEEDYDDYSRLHQKLLATLEG